MVYDVAVVGAGPAGSATALWAARAGLSTLLVERSAWPRDKVCGACLHPSGVRELARLDPALEVSRLGARPLSRARVTAQGRSACLPVTGAAALSRTRLDAAIVDRAIAFGAHFRPRTSAALDRRARGARRVLELAGEGGSEAVEARLVVAADGLGSPLLSRASDFRSPPERGARVGLGARLASEAGRVAEDEVELIVGRGGYVGLVRLEDRSIDLAAALDPAHLGAHGPAGACARILSEAGRAPLDLDALDWRGTPALWRRSTRLATDHTLAVGDATGYVEPFTGEGMTWALVAARLAGERLPELVANWSSSAAAEFTRATDRALGPRRRRCGWVARFVRHPRVVALAATPIDRSRFLAAFLGRLGYGPARP